jgi:putative Holliday junction resolvase
VEFVDERLSTVAAERSLLEADMSRAKRKEVINHLAAAHVLQGYLDSQRPPLPEHPPEEEP